MKIAELISVNYDEHEKTNTILIYIFAVIGLILGLMFINIKNTGDYIIKYSLITSNILLLFYIILFHWNELNDYYKLILIGFGISGIINYIYTLDN
jgi:hypothetical protein